MELRARPVSPVAVAAIVLLVSATATAQDSVLGGPMPTDTYIYPVKPGTARWRLFKSTAEELRAYQIPADTLRTISTEGLIETCLRHPLIRITITASNNPQLGVDMIAWEFNGVRELLARPDAGRKMLLRLKQIDPTPSAAAPRRERADFVARLYSFECLFAQREILRGLTVAERRAVLRECLRLYDAHVGEGALWVAARILEAEGTSGDAYNPDYAAFQTTLAATGDINNTGFLDHFTAEIRRLLNEETR
jgi:hypothetical protein